MKRYSPRHVLVALAAALALGAVLAVPATTTPVAQADAAEQFTITGSTQMYTLGALLANRYQTLHPGVHITVVPSSSQSGFDQTCIGSTQFGMSDNYIQDSQLREPLCDDMTGIPVAVSATPLVYNLPGAYFNQRAHGAGDRFTLAHPIKLTPGVVANIYLCKVTRWNDAAIARLNPRMKLPAARIQPFVISEAGGSSFVFDQWLARFDNGWKNSVGEGALQPPWPSCSTGVPTSGALVQAIQNTYNSVGYVGFDYAIANRLQAASLKNATGAYLTPSLNGLSYAIQQALRRGFPSDFRKSFVDAAAPNAFNPADFEFFVVHRNLVPHYAIAAQRRAMKDFLAWAMSDSGGQAFIESINLRKEGSATVQELRHGFIPVPEEIRKVARATVALIKI